MGKHDIRFFHENGYFPAPHILQVEVTNRCSLSCPQCYKEKSNTKDMELNLFYTIIKEAADLKVGTLMINGGEPFEHKYIVEILKLLQEHNFQIHCFSSGSHLNDEIIDILKENKIDFNLSISLNGSTKEIHNLSRDGFDISVAAIEKLQHAGLKFGINWVCRHDNVRDLPTLVQYSKNKGAKWLNIAANKLDSYNRINSPLNLCDYKFLIDYLNKESIQKFIRIQYCYNILNDLRNFGFNQHLNRCAAGMICCNIDVNGDFRPCTHLYYPEKFNSIKAYWNDSVILNQLRKSRLEKQKCINCKKPGVCYFCKAMFTNTFNDFVAEPNECPLRVYYDEIFYRKDFKNGSTI